MKIARAARKVELNVSTAKFLVKQYKKAHPEWAGQSKVGEVTPTNFSSSATEENQTLNTPQQASYLPYYFPFYPGSPYPWLA